MNMGRCKKCGQRAPDFALRNNLCSLCEPSEKERRNKEFKQLKWEERNGGHI